MQTAAFPKLQCNIFQSNRWLLCCYLLTCIAPQPNFILFWRQNIIWKFSRSYSHYFSKIAEISKRWKRLPYACIRLSFNACFWIISWLKSLCNEILTLLIFILASANVRDNIRTFTTSVRLLSAFVSGHNLYFL